MKKILLALSFLMGISLLAQAQKTNLTIKVTFKNIQDGYDHDTKTKVFIDGEEISESQVHKQSKSNSMTVEVPKGSHTIRVMNYALYGGNWEEHTVDNNYSIDCFIEETHSFSKKETLYLIFDLQGDTRHSWNKAIK